MATTKKTEDYTDDSVQHLTSRDAVRKRTGMYLGEPGPACAFTATREVLDNVVDEALNGHASKCNIYFDEDGSVWVWDDGRGMPVGMIEVPDSLIKGKKHKIPALQAITGLLHAGAKFDAGNSAYKISRGTHGIGIKGTNFTSHFFQVWTKKGESWHTIAYKDGNLVTEATKCKAPEHPFLKGHLSKGTLVHFHSDAKILGADKFPMSMLVEWATVAAYFTKGLTVTATKADGKSKSWNFPRGPVQYLDDTLAKLTPEHVQGKPFIHQDALVSCVATFTSHDGCELAAFTNGLRNKERGTHFDSFFTSLEAAIKKYRKPKQDFNPSDLRDGVVGLINVSLSVPKFGGQTKEKLVDENASKPLQDILTPALTKFFAENKATAEWICERADALNKLKSQFKMSRKVISALKSTRKAGLPAKAQLAPECPAAERELFIVEGDSAGGCFVKETKLALADGTSMSIADLYRQGTNWMGLSLSEGKIVVSEFTRPVVTKEVDEVVEIELDDGSVLRCTPDHPFLTEDGSYQQAQDLEGKRIVRKD